MELKLDKSLIIFDLETTGLGFKDKIVEISLIKVYPDGREESYTKRVNPGIPIPPEATKVHGIISSCSIPEPEFIH